MPVVTVRNLPEETHRALKLRAAQNGRSTEAEIRAILEEVVRPETRFKNRIRARRLRTALRWYRYRPAKRASPDRACLVRMIVLDTNVISEPMRPHGSPAVRTWLDRQVAETLYLTATSLAELLVGIEILPRGKRKEGLATALAELVGTLFGSRILPFDQQAAAAYALVVGRARAAGTIISVADGQIAAIAAVHGYSIATRDAAPFRAAGLLVIDPWEAGS